MGSKQRYTKDHKSYDIDEFFLENLQDMEFELSVKIAKFIEKNLTYIPTNDLVSYCVGGLVMYRNHPITFCVELVRTEESKPILSDIELISIDEYLDLMNLNLYIKSNEFDKS